MKTGFDNEKYLKTQSEHIRERIAKFGDKLYLEFGGKLYDDYHASRVLPGFEPDSKLRMLMQLSDQAEIVIVISAKDIDRKKIRGDIGITYDEDVLRLKQLFEDKGLYVSSVVVTHFTGQESALKFKERMTRRNINVYMHYFIEGYPSNIPLIVSDDGFGRNEYVRTTRPLIVVTAPGPGSGKMATCLSQLYHENKRGVKAGYAKFETFPIWNIPLKHPINLAYEAATADLDDVNMIDPFHLEAYGETTVNYNRDIEIFPVLNAMFEEIYGKSPYKSPTDMGVNMAGNCIIDDEVCCEASKQEIIRRYYTTLNRVVEEKANESEVLKIEFLMKQAGITTDDRKVTVAANDRAEKLGVPTAAIELETGEVITSKTTDLLGASAALLLNALKYLGGVDHDTHLISPEAIEPIAELKVRFLGGKNPRLHTDEVLIALSIASISDENAKVALSQIPKLKGLQAHTSVMLSPADIRTFKRLGVEVTSEPVKTVKKKSRPVLVIMAAGMGSRYGGLKQIDTVDDENDRIIDFSIYDAKRAGFKKVIFIIKKENLELFREAVGDSVSKYMEVEYVFQELDDIPEGEQVYPERSKPYGTAHAVRSARNVVNGPFAVINADDFYGREAFRKIYDFLEGSNDEQGNYCMVAYKLVNTLTMNGSVSRGIISVDENENLVDIEERSKVIKTAEGAAYTENDTDYISIPEETLTSMNMWGFTADFLEELDKAFTVFYKETLPKNVEKAECYLPFVVGDMIEEGRARVKVLSSSDRWFGVTYREDKEYVREKIAALKEEGVYPKELWKE